MYFEKPLGCAVVARTVENYHLCLSQYILYLTTLGIFSVPQICTRIPELHSVPQICRRISEFQCLWETQLARNLRTWLQEQQGQCLQITHLRNRIPKLKGAAEQGGVTHRVAKDMRLFLRSNPQSGQRYALSSTADVQVVLCYDSSECESSYKPEAM